MDNAGLSTFFSAGRGFSSQIDKDSSGMAKKRKLLLVIPLFLFCLSGCDMSDMGFRFYAQYEAPRGGYRINLVSQGYVEPGNDLATAAFAIVNFCPVGTSKARPLQMTLVSNPEEWIKLECKGLGVDSTDLNWRTSESVLGDLLIRAGYDDLDTEELKGTAKVIMNSLTGPKGVMLKGQITSVTVLHTDIKYGYRVMKDQPKKQWIDPADVQSCEQK
jgi:hypothetical protein